VLGLAAVAHARGLRPGPGTWHVLDPATASAADRILGALGEERDPEVLARAVGAAMGEGPATAAPAWAAPMWSEAGAMERVGRALSDRDAAAALGAGGSTTDRSRALACLAVSLCRSIDAVRAVAERLGAPDGEALERMARLAQARVRPGEPTRARDRLRRLLAEDGGG